MKLFNFLKKEPTIIEQEKSKVNVKTFVQSYSKVDLPKFKEITKSGWVSYGDNNDFPEFLLELTETSAIHNGIVNGKSYLVAGDSFLLNDKTDEHNKTLGVDLTKFNAFINNAYGESWYDIKAKLAIDYTLSGSYALLVYWSNDFSRIVKVEHMPWQYVRPGIMEDGKVQKYFVSENWKGRKVEAEEYQSFDINSHLPNGLSDEYESIDDYPYDHVQLLYVKNHYPGWKYFGRPSYIGALTSIKATATLSQFYLSSVENGFTPSMIITFNEMPGSDEQGNEIRKNLEKQFTAKGASRKLAVFFANNKDTAPTYTPLDIKNLDQQMLALQKELYSSIITAHSVTSPELVGISVAGQLGSSSFEEKWNLFNKTVIQKDKAVIERTINILSSLYGVEGKISIEDKKLF